MDKGRDMRRYAVLLSAVLLVTGCGLAGENRHAFEGIFFSASVKADRQRPKEFVVTLKDPAQNLRGAAQAIDYEAIKYCVKSFGTSRVSWDEDPKNLVQATQPVPGSVSYAGVCTVR